MNINNIFKEKFLKQKTGLSDSLDNFTLSFPFGVFLGFVLMLLSYIAKGEVSNNNVFFVGLIIFIFPIVSYVLIMISLITINKIRKKIPYQINTIYEENKQYEVHNYPIFETKEYYHKGKLHREIGFAIIFINDNHYANEYYLNGKLINKNNFESQKIKNKIEGF